MNADLAGPRPTYDRYELAVVNPDGVAKRWAIFPSRASADLERIRLAKVGFYAIVRRLDEEPPE